MKVNDAWMRIKRALSVDVSVAEIKKKKERLPRGIFPPSCEKEKGSGKQRMQQGCPQPHEEVPSALETLLLESASYNIK
jgi:hypothetical protein